MFTSFNCLKPAKCRRIVQRKVGCHNLLPDYAGAEKLPRFPVPVSELPVIDFEALYVGCCATATLTV